MPNIKFTLLDNTSQDITTVSGRPAGVAVPVPINVSPLPANIPPIEEFDSISDFEAALTERYTGKIISINDDTYLQTVDMIRILLTNGFRVITCATSVTSADDRPTLTTAIQTAIKTNELFEDLKSRNNFDVQFLTTGVFGGEDDVASEMAEVAAARGECIALVELPDNTPIDTAIGYNYSFTNKEYAAAFYPQIKLEFKDSTGSLVTKLAPACLGYLLAYANSTTLNPDYFAVAGATRGIIPNLKDVATRVTDADASVINGSSGITRSFVINPIMNVYGHGIRIYGNRTCLGVTDTQSKLYKNFLNVMILVSDIIKRLQLAAGSCMFDPNDNVTWLKFINLVYPLLEDMKANRGISYYKWVKEASVEKGVIKATLHIRPIEAVEDFVLTVNLVDDDGVAALEATI